ncbi:tyrosine-specific transport protein [Vibrio astriarenae]|nr:tyrosine-specific transport protein [Vibrio sp. C7]
MFSDKSSWIASLLSTFTGLALLTSFFGVAMALFNQNRDMFNQNKAVTYALTFVLPLVGSLLAADKFSRCSAMQGSFSCSWQYSFHWQWFINCVK